jgi:hypothetical protein
MKVGRGANDCGVGLDQVKALFITSVLYNIIYKYLFSLAFKLQGQRVLAHNLRVFGISRTVITESFTRRLIKQLVLV